MESVVQASSCGGHQPTISGVAKNGKGLAAYRSSRLSYAELAFANLYSRIHAVGSDGCTGDVKIQSVTIVEFCRPSDEKLNRYSVGQKLSGLEQNTTARHIDQRPDAGNHHRIAEE